MGYSIIMATIGRLSTIAVVVLLLATTQPSHKLEPPLPQSVVQDAPIITTDPESRRSSTEISVLIYNVAALPWPIRGNRTKALQMIGDELAAAREAGNAPDIVLIQEGFRRSMDELISRSGYPNWVRGPARDDRMPEFSDFAEPAFRDARRWTKAEGIGKITDSGLYVLSDWPILRKVTTPFYASECAGYDCAANKGVLWVDIEIPGVPVPLQVFTTHLNARKSTGVPEARSLEAYDLQVRRMEEFVDNNWDRSRPLIYGGDFNAKGSPERFALIEAADRLPDKIVQRECLSAETPCEMNLPIESETPWLDTQDWQGWAAGGGISITALRAEHWFTKEYADAPKIKGRQTLSDHHALFVRYELTWPSSPSDSVFASFTSQTKSRP